MVTRRPTLGASVAFVMRLGLTKQGRYGIRAAVELAGRPFELRKRHEIAAATSVPPRTLAQVLACLRRAGLVEAAAGRGGGYRLSRSPAEITVLEVIEAIEGDVRERTCVLRSGPCDGSCAFHGTWLSAHEALLARLGGTTLRDIARGDRRAA